MNRVHSQHLVLALYPSSRGFAYAYFESPLSLYDWGVKETRSEKKNEAAIKGIGALIERCRPDLILIENFAEQSSRRSERIKNLYRMIIDLAKKECIVISSISQDAIHAHFFPLGAKTKYEIAQVIAEEIPVLAHRLPRLRRIWMSEDPRQSLFDAVALGVTCCYSK